MAMFDFESVKHQLEEECWPAGPRSAAQVQRCPRLEHLTGVLHSHQDLLVCVRNICLLILRSFNRSSKPDGE